MSAIAVIDHGAGNLVSIGNGLRRIGASVEMITSPDDLADKAGIVLPGVGSAAAAMARLVDTGMDAALRSFSGPILGICVGFQLLFDRSAEGEAVCLGLIPGRVSRLTGRPLPHMGWNDVTPIAADPLFASVGDRPLFYFVHSFAPQPTDPASVVATAEYEGEIIVAAARRGPIAGVQFHPERSGAAGRAVLRSFVEQCPGVVRAA